MSGWQGMTLLEMALATVWRLEKQVERVWDVGDHRPFRGSDPAHRGQRAPVWTHGRKASSWRMRQEKGV